MSLPWLKKMQSETLGSQRLLISLLVSRLWYAATLFNHQSILENPWTALLHLFWLEFCIRPRWVVEGWVAGFLENCSIVVLHTKSNRSLLKTMAIFLNSVVKKRALIWLVPVGFFSVFNQSETICNFHSCYKIAFVLQENCTPFSATCNQNWVIFWCILLPKNFQKFQNH